MCLVELVSVVLNLSCIAHLVRTCKCSLMWFRRSGVSKDLYYIYIYISPSPTPPLQEKSRGPQGKTRKHFIAIYISIKHTVYILAFSQPFSVFGVL